MSSDRIRSRRRFLKQSLGLLGAAGLSRHLSAMVGMDSRLPPNQSSPSFNPDVEIELVCRPASVPILKGSDTRVLQYFSSLLKGPEQTLSTLPDSYLGRIMRFHTGQKIRIHFRNGLSEPTITHWHGLHVPALMDGHPRYVIRPGETFVYEFELRNRASMNIYHPHPHEATARQVYHGLAGALIVHDDEERRLELPSGEFELPIVIQDRRFDTQNQLVYAQSMHDRMVGYYGDTILINGRANHRIEVASRAYRLRVLNGSTARIYKLAWDDGTPLTILGVDGGLLASPISKPYVMLAPGERLDVWADFSGRTVGSELIMRSRPFTGVLPMMMEGMGGMMHGMSVNTSLPVGSDYALFTIKVTRAMSESPKLPTRLSDFKVLSSAAAANSDRPVPIAISEGPMAMLLNGRSYTPNDILPSERIPLNSIQLLEIFHAHGGHGGGSMGGMGEGGMGMMGRGMGMMGRGRMGGGMGMMMSMAHPIHLHGQSFQIIGRHLDGEMNDAYASVRDGFIESGWKDTVLVMPGERVRIIKPFQDYKGLFMYHCHNLEHEDLGMMRDFSVE